MCTTCWLVSVYSRNAMTMANGYELFCDTLKTDLRVNVLVVLNVILLELISIVSFFKQIKSADNPDKMCSFMPPYCMFFLFCFFNKFSDVRVL